MVGLIEKVAARIPRATGYDHGKLKAHVLERIKETPTGTAPFYHLYIEKILPDDVYADLHALLGEMKTPDHMQTRDQDSAAFVNRRFSLRYNNEPVVRAFSAVFEDPEVKAALAERFYANVTRELVQGLSIHRKEFEFVFCEPDRFQNIHVDIPPKFMSFVFYLPQVDVTPEDEERNATVLYDRDLEPVYGARFRPNSVCVFVPHFYSYHGFSTTVERDVMVMFYINKAAMKAWNEDRGDKDGGPQYEWLLDQIENKLRKMPLIEYGDDPGRIAKERADCQVNAPQGRVMVD